MAGEAGAGGHEVDKSGESRQHHGTRSGMAYWSLGLVGWFRQGVGERMRERGGQAREPPSPVVNGRWESGTGTAGIRGVGDTRDAGDAIARRRHRRRRGRRGRYSTPVACYGSESIAIGHGRPARATSSRLIPFLIPPRARISPRSRSGPHPSRYPDHLFLDLDSKSWTNRDGTPRSLRALRFLQTEFF